MLVLSRKIGEEIIIDGDVIVRVVDIRGSRISLGISADSKVRVTRAELLPMEHPRIRERDLAGVASD